MQDDHQTWDATLATESAEAVNQPRPSKQTIKQQIKHPKIISFQDKFGTGIFKPANIGQLKSNKIQE